MIAQANVGTINGYGLNLAQMIGVLQAVMMKSVVIMGNRKGLGCPGMQEKFLLTQVVVGTLIGGDWPRICPISKAPFPAFGVLIIRHNGCLDRSGRPLPVFWV